LDRQFYTDPKVFDLEMERVFARTWLFVGHISLIPTTGDYVTFNIANESIIILRSAADEQVHALYNVCRHRGSRICLEPSGHVKKLVCPYHAWIYDTDGCLLGAKHMPVDFDKSCYGLHRCQVRVVQGLIFICLTDKAPDFNVVANEINSLFEPHGFEHAKVCHTETFRIRCNWKIAGENTWECYHCSHAHPEYCSVMPYATAFNATRQRDRDAHMQQWDAYARGIGHHVVAAETIATNAEKHIYIGRGPIQPGFLTQSMDGKPVAPLMGRLKEYDGGLSGFMTFPIIWFAASSDHALLTRFTPINADETEAQYTWLVDEDAVEGVDFDVDHLTRLWRVTAAQDKRICEDNQVGVNSLRYQPGPYSDAEKACDAFTRWYLDKLQHD
jgi:Rieske 2Fe-2S family protein